MAQHLIAMDASASLNVIALISGGKDSMYSSLHCLANGHKVVALANLYPAHEESGAGGVWQGSSTQDAPWDMDVDSYMYQTAGYNLIPLYADALGLPLYRQEITGGAQDSSKSYSASGQLHDETEALVPLLKKVLRFHPAANAVNSGAILSTYQRTRIESVAVRLGLVPLSYLWQYPSLPRQLQSGPKQSPSALLEDMAEAGFDVRIVKVATGGLDGSLLWSNLMGYKVREKIERAVIWLGGSVLGEGGEYETMVVKGPASAAIIKGSIDARVYNDRNIVDEPKRISNIWRGRIHITETDMRNTTSDALTFREGGGRVVPIGGEISEGTVSIPSLWDGNFGKILEKMRKCYSICVDSQIRAVAAHALHRGSALSLGYLSIDDEVASDRSKGTNIDFQICKSQVGNFYAISNLTESNKSNTAYAQMLAINDTLLSLLKALKRPTSSIVFTTIILRSMSDFPLINIAYGKLFTEPNPPARVTIACTLPAGIDIMVSVVVNMDDDVDALHVQSRSYWVPANIGPYSQAVSVSLDACVRPTFVFVAGQIPLVPATMEIIGSPPGTLADLVYKDLWSLDGFQPKCCLALQHLWRVGKEMKVSWWTGAVAFIARRDESYTKAITAWAAWREIHEPQLWEEPRVEDDGVFDIWERTYGHHGNIVVAKHEVYHLPDFEKTAFECDEQRALPYDRNNMTYPESQDFESPRVPGFFAVEVDELPRGSDIEWQSLGIAQSEVKLTTHSVSKPGHCHLQIRSCSVPSLRRFVSYIEILYVPGLEQGSRKTRLSIGVDWVKNVAAPGKEVHITIYTPDMSLVTDIGAQIIPCDAIWGPGGRRLAAGIVANFEIKDGIDLQSFNHA